MQLAKDVGVPESNIIQWDIEETKKGMSFFFGRPLYGYLIQAYRRTLQGNRRRRRHLRELHLSFRQDPSVRERRESFVAQSVSVCRLRCERGHVSAPPEKLGGM